MLKPLLLHGKCRSRPTVAEGTSGSKNNLYYLIDKRSGITFLVDTGATLSVFPATFADIAIRQRSPTALSAGNGSAIPTYGKKRINVTIGSSTIPWDFILAKVTRPLLGADFLRHYGLLIDVRNQRLIDATSLEVTEIPPTSKRDAINHISFSVEETSSCQFERLLRQSFPELLIPTFREPTVKHGVELHIETKGRPVFAKAQRLPPDKLEMAREDFRRMMEAGIIHRSKSALSSALHMVPKDDGTLRQCGDYRRLNEATKDDKYPVPHIQDFSANLQNRKIFSKVDLIRGYHQIPVAPEDIHKTAVVTPFGLFKFLRTPFGLKNATHAFQRLMDTVCQGLEFVFVYLDDILVASRNSQEHLEHLLQLFDRLSKHGLVLNSNKCQFGKNKLDFLGHVVTEDGISPTSDKVSAIQGYPQPETVRDLMRFNGMVNFYHRFIPNAALKMSPLYDATKGNPKPWLSRRLDWSTTMMRAFEETKTALSKSTILAHFDPEARLALTTEASDFAIGTVLEQEYGDSWRLLAFYSERFKPSKTELQQPLTLQDSDRSATERELLVAFRSVKHFRHILEGGRFTLFTDHKPLVDMMQKPTECWSSMQSRHLAAISEFTTNIQRIKGKNNAVADALSRIDLNQVSLGIDFKAMAISQSNDPETHACRTALTGLNLVDIPISQEAEHTLLCDISLGHPRPWVPKEWRKFIFDTTHGLLHPGVKATSRLISSRYVWNGLNKEVKMWAKQCLACQKSKVMRHVHTASSKIPIPNDRFAVIHMIWSDLCQHQTVAVTYVAIGERSRPWTFDLDDCRRCPP